jgi:hypothetical protein
LVVAFDYRQFVDTREADCGAAVRSKISQGMFGGRHRLAQLSPASGVETEPVSEVSRKAIGGIGLLPHPDWDLAWSGGVDDLGHVPIENQRASIDA